MSFDDMPPPPPTFWDGEEEELQQEVRLSVTSIVHAIGQKRLEGEQGILKYLYGIVKQASNLNITVTDWNDIELACIENGARGAYTKFKKAIDDQKRANKRKASVAMQSPYSIDENGRMVYQDENLQSQPIADFSCKIVQEVIPEFGDNMYRIEGKTIGGNSFAVDIASKDFEDDRKLRQVLGAAAGSGSVIHYRMGGHLAPAIKSFSSEDVEVKYLYQRTGWANGKFLIPGRLPNGIEVELTAETNYAVDPEGDIAIGMEALEKLIKSIGPEYTLPALAGMFAPQLLPFMGKIERYQTFIVGETNSFKSAWAKAAMQIFTGETPDRFLKWGYGSSLKGALNTATYAGNLALLIDNYRPDKGGGARALENLIHVVTEGGSRVLATIDGGVKESKPINCMLTITGEDFPVDSESAVTRTVLIDFPKPDLGDEIYNYDLLFAQENGKHLSSLGNIWLDWLENSGHEVEEVIKRHPERRQYWADQLTALAASVNKTIPKLRISDNLAFVETVLLCLKECPMIGLVMDKFNWIDVRQGIFLVAQNLVGSSTDANEGARFIAALNVLLESGRAIILGKEVRIKDLERDDRDRAIGWHLDDGTVGIMVPILLKKMQIEFNEDLNGITTAGLARKLCSMDAIICPEEGYAKQVRVGGGRKYLMIVKKEYVND